MDNSLNLEVKEELDYLPDIRWCPSCFCYHPKMTLWQKLAHMIGLKSQYDALELIPIERIYYSNPINPYKRKVKNKIQRESRKKNRSK